MSTKKQLIQLNQAQLNHRQHNTYLYDVCNHHQSINVERKSTTILAFRRGLEVSQ